MQKLTHEAAESLQYLRESTGPGNSILLEAVPTLRSQDFEALQDRLEQWAANIGALQPSTSSVSLDYRLRNAPATKTAIASHLSDLAASASQGTSDFFDLESV